MEQFYKDIWLSEEELLIRVRREREDWETFSYNYKLEIEADLKLLKNKRDKKKDEKLVWDSTLFNVHSALVARSYKASNTIKLKWEKTWVEREIKMLQSALDDDLNCPIAKALKYYKNYDKFATWVAIEARIWWDWVKKKPIFQLVDPLTWVMDPYWDYFLWEYNYTWFFGIANLEDLQKEYPDIDVYQYSTDYDKWAKEKQERLQRISWLNPEYSNKVTDIYYHYTKVEWKWIWVKTMWMDAVILEKWMIEPNNNVEKGNEEAIKPPFTWYYWKPDRTNPFWDRPANYIRDVQLQKAEIANLRINKMRAELYPMYLYNKDYVAGKDLNFWFNKKIPVTSWVQWAVNLDTIVRPIQKDLRIDSSFAVDQSLDRQVERSTSIWEVVQWTTPTRKETLWTNQLIASNTDVNLELNEEIHSVWEEVWINLWFGGYYQNFADWDKKLVYAWSDTAKTPIILKKKDFLYEWNLAVSIETNIASEDRKRKEMAWIVQTTPLILPTLWTAEKIQYLRFVMDRAWIPQNTISETLIDTPQMQMQKMENEWLKEDIFVPISPDDDDEQHLIAMWSTINTDAFEAHKFAHIQAMQVKWTQPEVTDEWWVSEDAVVNNMASQAMSQVPWQLEQ